MSRSQRFREPAGRRRRPQDGRRPVADRNLDEARERSDELERERRLRSEDRARDEEAGMRRQREIAARIDQLLTDDSEEFLANVRQPGGE
jgi:hypothetical protein